MTDLNLHWENGRMTIHMDNFFPCPQNKLKQLLKIIDDKGEWQDRSMYRSQILEFLHDAEEQAQQEMKVIAKDYDREMSLQSEMSHAIKDGRYANGLPVKKDDLKKMKEDLKKQKTVTSDLMKNFKDASRKAKKLHTNADFIKGGGEYQ